MADTATRCLKCGRFAGKKANYCPSCGNDMRSQKAMAEDVDGSFSEAAQDLLDQMDEIDATEIISIIRRPDDTIAVDIGDVDEDVALSLMIKGIIVSVLADLEMINEDEDEDEQEDEG